MNVKKPAALKYFDMVKGESLTDKDLDQFTEEIKKICTEFPAQVEKLKSVLSKEYDKVYAIGIGDSLYSADSTKLNFWKKSGVQIEVLESQEFNNYYLDYMPKNSLVLICSGGGSAARTVESSFLAQSRGATVVAVTLTPKSRLTASCQNVLCYSTDNNCYIDGSRNYMGLTLLLKIVGIKLGLWNGNIPAAEELAIFDKIVKDMAIGFKACMTNEQLMKDLMKETMDQKKFYFLGAGPSMPLAQYGAAKFMEQSAADGIWQQLEEYGHEQYWVHNRREEPSVVFNICPDGKTVQRCVENLDEQNFLDLNTVLVTNKPINASFTGKAKYTIATDEFIEETDFWMMAGNIFARMANFYTEYIEFSDKRFLSGEQFVEHYKTIHYSQFSPEVAQYDIPCPDDQTIAERGAFGLTFNTDKTAN
ncbi:SIS domain-containing protein [Pelolinea submarina]|uniref:Glutamine--fructose-6-phosphate aminotransferase [isomerizing] n=1 Tax=Pelolinea submarina TaxID=913107 RepID=A0A347ZQS6_9CHLR|nr:SIS domain-containing protein [Pelolinea submarina]REG11787.1 SIS domain-containing protein [Pelolinea submarina]BBB47657.1 glucosamine--fructose-6-phosphate aminotransferase (isomerizing) [Pelolinea submarina]